MKAQRLKITQKGWETFSDVMLGVEFKNGISIDAVAPSIANQLGSILSVEAIDDAAQVGAGAQLKNTYNDEAKVVEALTKKTPETVSADQVKDAPVFEAYTREQLEAIADQDGIGGLRAVAEKFGIKGRGINELITEILRYQG